MAAIISDVFGGLEVALRKINSAAVALATADKIFDNFLLVAFTNHVIENYNLLVVSGQHFQRNNLMGAFDNIITSHRIDSCIEIINHVLVLVLMQVLCTKVNFVVDVTICVFRLIVVRVSGCPYCARCRPAVSVVSSYDPSWNNCILRRTIKEFWQLPNTVTWCQKWLLLAEAVWITGAKCGLQHER